MADVGGVYAVRTEEFLFERENREQPLDGPPAETRTVRATTLSLAAVRQEAAGRDFLTAGGLPRMALLQSWWRMPIATENSRLTVNELAERSRSEMIPLTNTFSYFCT